MINAHTINCFLLITCHNFTIFCHFSHSAVLQLGLAAGCSQLSFSVLDWNKPSLEFYYRQGCYNFTAESGYQLMRCEGEALEKLAQP